MSDHHDTYQEGSIEGWETTARPSRLAQGATFATALLILGATATKVLWPFFFPPTEPEITLEEVKDALRQDDGQVRDGLPEEAPEVQWSYVLFKTHYLDFLGVVQTGWEFVTANQEGEELDKVDFPNRQWCNLISVDDDGVRRSVTLAEKEGDGEIEWFDLNRGLFSETSAAAYFDSNTATDPADFCDFAETEEDVRERKGETDHVD